MRVSKNGNVVDIPVRAGTVVKGAGDVYPVGRAKRVPKMCKEALAEYKKSYGDR